MTTIRVCSACGRQFRGASASALTRHERSKHADLVATVPPFCPVGGQRQQGQPHHHDGWPDATFCDQCGDRLDDPTRTDPECVGCGSLDR